MKTKIFIISILVLNCSISLSQIKNYNYKREINGISKTWHKIILPDDIFGKVSRNLSDIRIIGITKNNDTTVAPYILRITTGLNSQDEINFKLINQSRNPKGFFYTFELPAQQNVNKLILDFKKINFDWKVTLGGSQDLKEWFTIADNYRIVSIKNNLTDYKFTTVSFPDSKYRYFRLLIQSSQDPELLTAKILKQNRVEGDFKNYTGRKIKISEDNRLKQTNIEISLPLPVPVSSVKLFLQNRYDYYRPVSIFYSADSIYTQNGWKHNFELITSGILSSLENHEFQFPNTISNKFKIVINNYDNQPLKIDSVGLSGNIYQLIARFTEDADYYLVYSNARANKPNYDIDEFIDKIPVSVYKVSLGDEQKINSAAASTSPPLFQNKAWLWSIMIIIIAVLGWFTLRMFRKND